MANRPKGFGMTAELARKKEAKFDPDLANEAFEWLRLVLTDGGKEDMAGLLKVSSLLANILRFQEIKIHSI